MLLRAGTYKAGIRATEFAVDDKGIGWLIGHGDPAIVRTYYCDAPGRPDRGRARAAREAAGTLAGYCIGEHGRSCRCRLLADVAAVTEGAERIWSRRSPPGSPNCGPRCTAAGMRRGRRRAPRPRRRRRARSGADAQRQQANRRGVVASSS